MNHFFQVDEVNQQRAKAGKRYLEFLRVPAMSAGVYVLPKGGTDPQKPHQQDEMYYVVQGRSRMQVGAEHREVERGAARQRLQRQQPQQLAGARLDLRELAPLRVHLEGPREARHRELVRQPRPREGAFERAHAALEVGAIAELVHERVQVLGVELERERLPQGLADRRGLGGARALEVVARDLERIFDYRRVAVERLLGGRRTLAAAESGG